MAAVIKGVKIGPSPNWLQARLRGVGARPINNVVDATNYILFELNQPLHAFDLARLRGNRIVVRSAVPGEQMATLDGETREFDAGMTLICDAEGAVAVGGVMGGENSEVTEQTTDILLECAYFDPKTIRATRKALRMITDASYRFERGTDINAMPDVMRRAVQLIRTVAGGEEPETAVDVYPKPMKSRSVFLRPERVAHLLGVSVEKAEIERHLSSVGFVVAPKDDRFAVQVPGWRPDVTREVDLIEEIARLVGYDEFPVEMRPFRPTTVPDDPIESIKARIRRVFVGLGLNEARSLSLVAKVGERGQKLQNPMSVEEACLRESLLEGLVKATGRNWSMRERDIRLFELGTVFESSGSGRQPTETLRLAGVLSGSRTPSHWTAGGVAPDCDIWDLKYMLDQAVASCNPDLHYATSGVGEEGGWTLQDEAGRRRGWGGLLSVDRPAWAAPLFGFEIDVATAERAGTRYRPAPTTPPVERDLALVLPAGVRAEQVESIMQDAAGELLETIDLFDEYKSGELAGRSVAWRLTFRAPDRTLKDKEVDRIVERVLKRLKEGLSVERREA